MECSVDGHLVIKIHVLYRNPNLISGKNLGLKRNNTEKTIIFLNQFPVIFHLNIRRPLHRDKIWDDFYLYNFLNKLNSFRFLDAKRMEWKISMYATWRA